MAIGAELRRHLYIASPRALEQAVNICQNGWAPIYRFPTVDWQGRQNV